MCAVFGFPTISVTGGRWVAALFNFSVNLKTSRLPLKLNRFLVNLNRLTCFVSANRDTANGACFSAKVLLLCLASKCYSLDSIKVQSLHIAISISHTLYYKDIIIAKTITHHKHSQISHLYELIGLEEVLEVVYLVDASQNQDRNLKFKMNIETIQLR